MQVVLLASRFVTGEKYIRGAICNEEELLATIVQQALLL
jgi:hypothetical protein